MPSSGYTAITFVANEQPTTAKWNLIGSNDSSFNLGTGLEDSVIIARHLAANAVKLAKIDVADVQANQQAWQTLSLNGSWVPFGGAYIAPRYMKDSLGFVHVEGLIKSGTMGTVAATLPAGYRPGGQHYWGSASSGAIGIADVATNGTITPQVGSNGSFMMDYIFKAEN